MKQVFQFIDFIKKTKQDKQFFTKVFRISKDIIDKYSRFTQFAIQRKIKSSSKNIAIIFYFEEWIINISARRKSIKKFIKILLNVEKVATELNSIDYKITSLNKLFVNSKNMRNWNNFDNSKDKNKQRKSIENINNQDELSVDIDPNQIQRAKSNHELNFNQTLFEKMKARIVELMQHGLFDFIKAQQQAF